MSEKSYKGNFTLNPTVFKKQGVYLIPLFNKWDILGSIPFILFKLKVTSISKTGARRINKLEAIGKDGTINQDFGRSSYVYNVSGELYAQLFIGNDFTKKKLGTEFISFDSIEKSINNIYIQHILEYCFLKKIPFILISDIDNTTVIIESLQYSQTAERSSSIKFDFTLLDISSISPENRLLRNGVGLFTTSLRHVGEGLIKGLFKRGVYKL